MKDVIQQDLQYICANLQSELRQMAGKSLLITGGAGFLGYYLVQSVVHWNGRVPGSDQIEVTVFDNFSRGMPEWLDELRMSSALTLIEHDVTTPLPARMSDYDYIIHAASIASPTFYRQYPIQTMDANVNGLRHLLEYSNSRQQAGKPITGFLYFSTSEIYGDPDPAHVPTPETYRGYVSCTGPRACYDESKRFGETLCVNFAAVYDLPIKIARPFNNYGPGLKITDRRVLPDFAQDVLNGRDIVMLSNGSPTRAFCYVADAVVGYYKILVRGGRGEAYNIGTESPEISMLELAEKVVSLARELFGYKGNVVRQISEDADYLTDNPNRRCPLITKARTELGYEPAVSLEDGLRRSLLWYGDNIHSKAA